MYDTLGYGFLEKVYDNVLVHELRGRGYAVLAQQPIDVWYDGVVVGQFVADAVVNDKVVLVLESVSALTSAHEAQLLNYLKATRLQAGLMLNFGPKPQIKRKPHRIVMSSEGRTATGRKNSQT